MPAFLMQFVNSIKAIWAKMSVMQRVAVLGGLVLVGSAAIGLSIWASRPDLKVLYSNLSAEDASVVIKSLQADKVMYQLTDNGKTILVPKEMVYDERIKIAGEGGLVGQGIGFEIFDKVKVGQTDFVQKINYTRALQGELSRTISEFPGVESARVHLVIPHRSLFVEERQSPSASVVLKLKHPNVKPDQKEINAILNMMLMAVEGLDKTHISISDNGGKVLYQPESDSLAGASSTQMEHRQQVQRNLERRIEEMLQPMFGPGRVIAKVNVDMDFSQRTIRRELFDPEKTAVRSEQRSEETQQGRSNLEGGSPDANFRGDGVTGSASTQNGSRETRTTNYEINKEEQQIVTNVGDLKRMTVAVLIDGTYEKTNGAWTFMPRKADDLERVRQLVTNAVGLDKARGDALEVSSAPFTDSEPPKDPNFAEMLADYAERLGKPLLNALLAFLFLMLVVRPVVLALIRPKVEAGEMIEGLEGLPAAEEQLALYEALEEAAKTDDAAEVDESDDDMVFKDVEALKAHIFTLSDNHMEQVVMLVRGWMKNDETATA
ncbi:flagellar M-ring protein FliF [Desulfovibrio desulfuricans]|uniref:Flagellar M-ring protein n=1 Tax=Desulfovibrio desulfuricans TaxID=876 RepID=A0A4V1CX85_DESDE|nr:flagellar basal-body MS-ring/collar protein FliF [Desulfovibrio desulfuricans]QCC85340.1 flagellar M-ring protein FliF [Desulfovibrio desulfuricans]